MALSAAEFHDGLSRMTQLKELPVELEEMAIKHFSRGEYE